MPAPYEKPTPRLYFVSAPVDFLFIGGLSILLYFVLPWIGHGGRTPQVVAAGGALVWLVNWPHFSATLYRLYHSSENTRQYPLTSWLLPPLVLAAALGSLASPAGVAPLFVKVFLLWSPFHFSGQTLGISLLYARRAGFPISKAQRLLLEGYIFSTFLLSTARAETSAGQMTYYSMAIPFLGLPNWVPQVLAVGLWASGAGFLALTAADCLRSRRAPPWILFLPATTQTFWFLLGPRVLGFYELVPLFHSLQYLLIAWAMQLKEKLVEDEIPPSAAYAWRETFLWGYSNFAGGAVLFWALPRIAAGAGVSMDLAMPVVIAAVQIHHFFVDGVIWKLKNPKVGASLMTNIAEFTGG